MRVVSAPAVYPRRKGGIRFFPLLATAAGFVALWLPLAIAAEHFAESGAVPNITAVTNGASFLPGVASSAWITIWGTNLSATSRNWASSDFVNGALPASLDGVSVKINGHAAYPSFIGSKQVNVLVPDDAPDGAVEVELSNPNGTSNKFTVNKTRVAPAFFGFTANYAAAVHADGTYAGKPGLLESASFTPARRGETLMLFGTGFGPTDPPLPAAQLVTTPAPLAGKPTVTIGGRPATVTYAGRTGAGLDQLNVTIPPDVPDGDALLMAQIDGLNHAGEYFPHGAGRRPGLEDTAGPAGADRCFIPR